MHRGGANRLLFTGFSQPGTGATRICGKAAGKRGRFPTQPAVSEVGSGDLKGATTPLRALDSRP